MIGIIDHGIRDILRMDDEERKPFLFNQCTPIPGMS